jgi:hypothetical protein
MKMRIRKMSLSVSGILVLSLIGSSGAPAPGPSPEALLRQQLIDFLDSSGAGPGALSARTPPALRSFPIAATTAYLLLENDPALLRKYYPDLSRMVMRLFEEGNAAGGLVAAMPGASSSGGVLSPGLNALADLELYSLHLIAWKTGAYEDALEYLASSNSLSGTITQSFYDPRRQCFYPATDGGRLVTTYGPGQLLPLILDRRLGSDVHARIAVEYLERSRASAETGRRTIDANDPWADPLMRFTMLDLLAGVLPVDGELFLALRASADSSVSAGAPGEAPWIDYWRENRFAHGRLFPPWRTISSLVNLTLLFERESLVPPKELAALRNGIDSLAAALSDGKMTLASYQDATTGVNRLLTWFSRFSELLDSKKERWRIIDEAKWLRLSPRTKRLVMEALASALPELARAKADLSARLERDCGIAFRLDLPERPISPGKPIAFSASLRVLRDTIVASQFYVQIGEKRWKMMQSAEVVTLAPAAAPLHYEGTLVLSPATEPGIITLPSIIDFIHEGRRVEIHRVGSIALMKEYDAWLDLPEGRRITREPVPVEITIMCKPDRDVQGTVEGTFLRELATTPPLPARFLVSRDSERTELTLAVAPKGMISPGRYPFSLTVALDGTPIARFEESLVRPFRWLHLGPLAGSDEALRNPLALQTDLLKAHTTSDGRSLRWKEAPSGAIDADGSLWPQRLYGGQSGNCMFLYTVVDCPDRMKLVWKLLTKNAVSLWINSEPIASSETDRSSETGGFVELRNGPNSFLIAACWNDSPDRILLEMSDENGLPPAGMSNNLDVIIDGFDRFAAPGPEEQAKKPVADRIRDVVVRYTNSNATEVSIIGSFNNWEPGATPMRREGKGTWTVHLQLRPGKYTYKLLVNRKQKIIDPANPASEPDGFGGSNSVLEVR